MDLRHLRAFAAVAESRSFSKAARRLRLAQPPLSRQIRQLEDEVGVKLFVRTTSGVQLTKEGILLLEQAQTVLAEANGFMELANRAKTGITTTLRVGMARGLCEAVNRIRLHLVARYPGAAIEGTDMPSSSQYAALRRRIIDIGVLRHVEDDPDIECQPLFEERFVVMLSEHNPLAKRKSLRLKQLARDPLLIHDREWAALAYDKILALYVAARVTPNIVTLHAVPGEQASMLAVASAEGICLALQSPISRSYVPVSGVAIVPLDEPDAELQVLVAWRKGETSRAILQFLESTREAFPADKLMRT
jgi:DNA-binding transcriptional LysR family regulator